MSEENKETVQAEGAPAEAASAAQKIKKINRIPADKLNARISQMEEAGEIQSRYYRHLVQRKKELEAGSAAV